MKTCVAMLALVAMTCVVNTPAAVAQDAFSLDAQSQDFAKKQRRLNIAGWTLVSAGIAFPLIAIPIGVKRDTDCEVLECAAFGLAFASFIVGPAMIVTGTGLLLRRRGLGKSHEAERQLAILPGLTGLTIAGTF